MTNETPLGSCERIGLLLSLRADGAATPSQLAEIDAHLPACEACRRAPLVDAAVARRLLARADAPAPSWLAGFAERTARVAIAQAREARAQNRLLFMSAAAAVIVAVTAQFALPGGVISRSRSGDAFNETAAQATTVRDSTRVALLRSHRLQRAGEGK